MKIKATDIGPVKNLDVQVTPGLNVLRGANGSGKSTVLKAVSYALTKTGEKPTARDGTRAGRIEAFGVQVTFTSRATAKGSLEVESLSGRLDLGDLILEQYEDPAVSDKYRIRKLIELSGAQATPEMFAPLLGSLIGSPAEHLLSGDLIDRADECKKFLQGVAREKESDAESYAHKQAAALQAAAGIDLTVETDPERLNEAYVQATADYQKLVHEHDQRLERIRVAQEAREKIEQAKAANVDSVEAATQAATAAMKHYQDACRHVSDLEKQLAVAQAEQESLGREALAADRNLKRSQAHESAMAAWESQVKASESLRPIPQEQVEAAKLTAQKARQAIESGALVRKAKEQLAASEDFLAAANKARGDAEKLRANAAKTDDILAAELKRIGCPWYPVEVPSGNGTARRLKTRHSRRGETLVSELSDGERARDAIDVALALSGKSDRPTVLILRQEQFEGLQPKVRAEIDQHAKERGVVILTAAASDDEEVTL